MVSHLWQTSPLFGITGEALCMCPCWSLYHSNTVISLPLFLSHSSSTFSSPSPLYLFFSLSYSLFLPPLSLPLSPFLPVSLFLSKSLPLSVYLCISSCLCLTLSVFLLFSPTAATVLSPYHPSLVHRQPHEGTKATHLSGVDVRGR